MQTMWQHIGQKRPDFAIQPGPGQESVWDYPRPPIAKASSKLVEVRDVDMLIARSSRNFRLLETASPPTYYLPIADVRMNLLVPITDTSVCEWKGMAVYFALARNPETPIAWRYPKPRPPFLKLKDCISFYPGRIGCYVDGERVAPQPGRFYGGWITSDVVGPFKGEPGTGHW